jgi:hypothetical protein
MTFNEPLFQFRHGDHICVFYRSDDALVEVLSPYIADGLRKRERCFCVQRQHITKRIQNDLRFIGVNVEAEIAAGALEFREIRETYLPDGSFCSHKMMNMLKISVERAVACGYAGLRTAGELAWAGEVSHYCEEVAEYEAMVQRHFSGRPVTGLCQYPMDSFSPDFLERILQHHPQRVVETEAPALRATMEITAGPFTTEIVAQKFMVKPRYDYVVAHAASRQVVGWGRTENFETARRKSEEMLRTHLRVN